MVPTAMVCPVFRVCLQLSLVFSLSQVSLTNCSSPPQACLWALLVLSPAEQAPGGALACGVTHFTEEEIVKLGCSRVVCVL